MTPIAQTRVRLAALAVAGVLFAAYPLTRPYADETTLAGARAIASPEWIASHTFAMLGFTLLAAALPAVTSLAGSPTSRRPERGAQWAVGLAMTGAALVLPYYGAEAFGLHAIAGQALKTNDPQLLTLLDTVRYQPVAITLFGVGLVLLAAAGAVLARILWPCGTAIRWGAIALGAGLLLFLPQFFAPAPLRMAHGILLGVGCVVLAVAAWRRTSPAVPASQNALELQAQTPA